MKIFWRTLNMLLFISVMFIFQAKLTDSQVLNLCTTQLTGYPCKLTCKTPDVFQTILFRKLPASSQEGGCASGGSCGATFGRTRYNVSQNAALNETYLDISSLVYADDNSQWVCDYGGLRSTVVELTVISIPTLVQFAPDPPTADLPQTLVGEAYCVYPASSLTVKLVYQDGQTNNTLAMTYPVPTTNGTNGCGSHEFTVTPSYQLTPTTLSGKSVRFWIEVTVAGQVIGSALTTETFVFPGTPPPTNGTNVTRQCSCSWLPCGWKCYYLYIMIVAGVVFLVLLIVGVCCCYRHGYFGKKKEENRKESNKKKVYDKNISGTENGQPSDSSRRQEHTAM